MGYFAAKALAIPWSIATLARESVSISEALTRRSRVAASGQTHS